jgi:hypothetical protein
MIAETIASTGKEVICLGQIAEMSDRVNLSIGRLPFGASAGGVLGHQGRESNHPFIGGQLARRLDSTSQAPFPTLLGELEQV